MNRITLRLARSNDLPELEKVEQRCFTAIRRSSRRALRNSLRSPSQQVWLALCGRTVAGAMVLRCHPQTLRIYSIGVYPAFRGGGVGRALVRRALREAQRRNCAFVSLEADRRDGRLIGWYQQFGFVTTGRLPDYYAPGRDAVRMRNHVYS